MPERASPQPSSSSSGGGAPIVPFEHAPRRILELAGAHPTDRPLVIGITGPVASGKSTLARLLSPVIVATDDYLPDYNAVPYLERDRPEHADLERLAADLRSLRETGVAQVPVWSFHSHRREKYRPVNLAGERLIVCEGIHALHHHVVPALDLRVFVDAPAATRLARWTEIAARGQRGWGVEETRKFFEEVAEPSFARFAPQYRAAAHVIVVHRQPGLSPAGGGPPST